MCRRLSSGEPIVFTSNSFNLICLSRSNLSPSSAYSLFQYAEQIVWSSAKSTKISHRRESNMNNGRMLSVILRRKIKTLLVSYRFEFTRAFNYAIKTNASFFVREMKNKKKKKKRNQRRGVVARFHCYRMTIQVKKSYPQQLFLLSFLRILAVLFCAKRLIAERGKESRGYREE